jgi:hypothetical protein
LLVLGYPLRYGRGTNADVFFPAYRREIATANHLVHVRGREAHQPSSFLHGEQRLQKSGVGLIVSPLVTNGGLAKRCRRQCAKSRCAPSQQPRVHFQG